MFRGLIVGSTERPLEQLFYATNVTRNHETGVQQLAGTERGLSVAEGIAAEVPLVRNTAKSSVDTMYSLAQCEDFWCILRIFP